jgi:hypothetical protein
MSAGGATTPGALLILWALHTGLNQQFDFLPTTDGARVSQWLQRQPQPTLPTPTHLAAQ